MRTIARPAAGEYAPYVEQYLKLLPPNVSILDHLKQQAGATREFILSLPPERLTYRYAKGKWTIKEILVHVMDTERIFAYRALRFARNDLQNLAGFEQDDYVAASGVNERDVNSILEEYGAMRAATVSLFESLPEEALTKAGLANGSTLSVRAAVWDIAGHELHHLNIIKERYLGETA